MDYQVVIVGGGPSGASLGALLRKQNISTLIIDKFNFPRKKLCAGGLTPNAFELYSKVFGEDNFTVCDSTLTTKLYFKTEYVMDLTHEKPLRFVDREVFDNQLLNYYISLGGKTLTGVRVLSVDKENNSVTLSNGEKIGYAVLVGADGANSVVRRAFDKDYSPDTFCIETVIDNFSDTHQVSIYCGEGGGYGWIFPHGKTLSIGYGGKKELAKYNLVAFKDFMRLAGVDVDNVKYVAKGAFIPMTPVPKPANGNILLIGDAGGFVFPMTGEGLYYAVFTAIKASESIIPYLSGNIPLAQLESEYFNSLYSIYGVNEKVISLTGRNKKKSFKRKFTAFCQNSKFIRKLAFRYARKHPELMSYAYAQVSEGACLNPFKIRKEFKKIQKQKKLEKKQTKNN